MSNKIHRRTVLKAAGVGVAGVADGYGLHKVNPLGIFAGKDTNIELPQGTVTTHTNPHNGDKVSALGFGCMRLPMLRDAKSPNGTEIDEEAFFEMVDLALAHGINYFDTA